MIIDNVHILHLIGLISIYRENTVKYLTTTSSTWFKAEITNKEKENLLMKLQQVNTFLHFLSFTDICFANYIYSKTKISAIDQVLLHH